MPLIMITAGPLQAPPGPLETQPDGAILLSGDMQSGSPASDTLLTSGDMQSGSPSSDNEQTSIPSEGDGGGEGVQLPAFFMAPAASGGDDSNPGTEDEPFLTLEKARDSMRGSSTKRTYLRAGTYNRTAELTLTSSDNNEIWIAYPVETPIIDGGGGAVQFLDANGANGLTWKGITFANSNIPFASGELCLLVGCPNWIVEDCHHDTLADRIWRLQSGSDGCKFLGNTFDSCTDNHIRVENSDNGVVAGNTVTNVLNGTSGIAPNFFGASGIEGWIIEYNSAENLAGAFSSIQDGGSVVNLNNTLRFNIIINALTEDWDDFGVMYQLGRSNAADTITLYDSNWIETWGHAFTTNPHHMAGIYLDDATSGVTLKNNVLIGGAEAKYAFFLHGGRNNEFFNNIALLDTGTKLGNPNTANQMALCNQQAFQNEVPGMVNNEFHTNILLSVNDAFAIASYGSNDWMTELGAGATGYMEPSVIQDLVRHQNINNWSGDTTETSSTAGDPEFSDAQNFDFELLNGASNPARLEGFADIVGVTDTAGAGPPSTWGIGGYDRANY